MSGKKVLLIDDERDLVDLVKMRLEANQYDVLTAFDGVEGVAMAQTNQPNLILLDVMMPKMDGMEALRQLKHNEKTRPIPVIMLTAKSDTPSIFRAQELGAKDYFTKPFEADELLAFIKRYL